jgi:hypothetical protein
MEEEIVLDIPNKKHYTYLIRKGIVYGFRLDVSFSSSRKENIEDESKPHRLSIIEEE